MEEIDDMTERVHEAMELFSGEQDDEDVDDLEKELGLAGLDAQPALPTEALPSVPQSVPRSAPAVSSKDVDIDSMLAELEV